MTITEFLEARIAEDEAVATKAADGSNGRWSKRWEDEAVVEGDNICVYDEGGHSDEQAEHIARYDPARILAECAAKRAILKGFEPFGTIDDIAAPEVLGILAAVYSDHPDYQQEWSA